VRFRDLGPLQVERAGTAQAVGGARLEAALALLLIHAGQAVSADALAEAMWGGKGGTRSATTLDSHIWRLRKVLEPERAPGSPPTVLRREPGGYRLVVAADRIDSARYAALAAEAGELLAGGAAARALQCAEEAGALWRGRPYGAAADRPWAAAATARLEEIRGRLRETHVGALLATGAAERALTELEAALAEEPLRERLWASRMVAYRDLGRRSDALATYAAARAALVDELGIEPGPELRALHAQLLRDDAGARRPSATHTLPATRSRLVGRDRELAAVLARLGADPLCTLVGPAGCGKTRLAVEAARQAAPGYPDGGWFVDLTSASPDRVLDTVASTLGLPLSGPADPTEALRRYTSARRMLVVLDNCEHVLDAAAELVDALLVGGSTLSVLATSREPLEVDGEQVVGLTPLPVPAAVELFLERLDTPPPADALDSVREIVAAVDGLPLALELAAGRARAFTLTEIAADVRVDASALSRVGRGRTHHRTVREAIDSSYRDLPGRSRRCTGRSGRCRDRSRPSWRRGWSPPTSPTPSRGSRTAPCSHRSARPAQAGRPGSPSSRRSAATRTTWPSGRARIRPGRGTPGWRGWSARARRWARPGTSAGTARWTTTSPPSAPPCSTRSSRPRPPPGWPWPPGSPCTGASAGWRAKASAGCGRRWTPVPPTRSWVAGPNARPCTSTSAPAGPCRAGPRKAASRCGPVSPKAGA
jgi:DNA-binding SARP family transcriptional activator